MTKKNTASSSAKKYSNDDFSQPRVVLVLQGGGALGAYQAGVFQALDESDLSPDWLVGTSIGAINAAIIAGNKREDRVPRLREFWELVSHGDMLDVMNASDRLRQANVWTTTQDTFLRGVPGFFEPRGIFNPFALGMSVDPEKASFYDTTPLAATLSRLIDFDYLNSGKGPRLTVNALKVACGNLENFDTEQRTIGAEHIMASGALPPGFAPVRIDGDLYWDGGLYSNTPLDVVLDDGAKVDTVCLMVDLWRAEGEEPTTLEQVQTRQKDVTYASRSQRHLEEHAEAHELRRAVQAMALKLPASERTKLSTDPALKKLIGARDDSTLHIVRLRYAGHDWNMSTKDVNFSKSSVQWRWEQGYEDAKRVIRNAKGKAFTKSETGLVIHDVPLNHGQSG
ncbi:patatin-like phospholipase family protein [Glaciimonas soli]|uniref:Patatin-like phospholipase family protein n=1 Tax=Glaciimonas soli TaxID=2590999 RepID=A0A843YYJ6_9BURK|nr:patatin-like phospholipase family protein [Glaciimonas soli]MQR01596.1 patatin-like phospholipase family protein [Glaciimonas soli]